jgi:hypothetical protein
LDEIELVLFTKAGKYPEKSQVILDNMGSLGSEADHSLQKVVDFRKNLREKLQQVSNKQLKVRRTQ